MKTLVPQASRPAGFLMSSVVIAVAATCLAGCGGNARGGSLDPAPTPASRPAAPATSVEVAPEMLANLRMETIHETTLPILAVAVASGFVSGSHFSRAYKSRFGKSPQEQRKAGAPMLRDS